jgi:TolB-like protein
VGVSAFVAAQELAVEPGTEPLAELMSHEDPSRIAVLYFRSRGGGDDAEFLAAGLTESLIDELSTVDALHVVSSNGSDLYRGSTLPLDSIGRALEVGTLVDGTVAVSGDEVRVSISMVDATDGTQFESRRFDRPRSEIFDLQDSLSVQVAEFLRGKVGEEVGQVQIRRGTSSQEAWERYQRAALAEQSSKTILDEGDVQGAGRELTRADSLFHASEEADEDWVAPKARRSWLAYAQSRLGGLDRSQYLDWIETGIGHADRALALAPNDADALEAKATLTYWSYLLNLADDPDAAFEEAEALFNAALAANPDQASAQTSLSHLLMNKGWVPEAKAAARTAYQNDPFLENANLTLWRLTTSSWDLEDAAEARRWCNEGLRRFPDDYRFHDCQVRVFALPQVEPDIPRAWEHYRVFVELTPPQLRLISEKQGLIYMAMALVRADLPDSARAVAIRGRASGEEDPVRALALLESIVWTWLEDYDEAIQLMGLYISANPAQLEGYRGLVANRDLPWYHKALADQPRFRTLVGVN